MNQGLQGQEEGSLAQTHNMVTAGSVVDWPIAVTLVCDDTPSGYSVVVVDVLTDSCRLVYATRMRRDDDGTTACTTARAKQAVLWGKLSPGWGPELMCVLFSAPRSYILGS